MADFRAGELAWNDQRLWPQFAYWAKQDPSRLAIADCSDRLWSRGEIFERAELYADELKRAGVNKGDRVLVAAHKSAAILAVALAVSSLEAVFCPHSPKLGQAEMSALEARLGHRVRVATAGQDAISIEQARSARSPNPDEADLALIAFTSGSTGVPKGVMHRSSALNYATLACAAIADLKPDDSILAIVPLDSAPGFTFTAHFALAQGRPLVLVDPWVPEQAMERAERYGCGWAIMVPTHLYSMVEAARLGRWAGRLPLRAAAVGGSAMTAELIADAEHLLGLKALRMFGMSECMGHCSTRPDDPLDRRQNSDGIPFPGTEEEAFNQENTILPRGSRGQAGVRGPSLFMGYAEGLGSGEARFTSDGFYLTGDQIVRDTDGYVKVVGRIKDQIIRGGFNIDPAEVEAALLRHPAIAEIAVVAVPHAKLGEQACAVCRMEHGAEPIDLPNLIEYIAATGISRKKWPEHLVLVDAMLITATGKIDKKAMGQVAVLALEHAPSQAFAS